MWGGAAGKVKGCYGEKGGGEWGQGAAAKGRGRYAVGRGGRYGDGGYAMGWEVRCEVGGGHTMGWGVGWEGEGWRGGQGQGGEDDMGACNGERGHSTHKRGHNTHKGRLAKGVRVCGGERGRGHGMHRGLGAIIAT